MTTKSTVLVVGSTGMLGFKIVAALLDKGTFDVKAMVRSSNDNNEENRQNGASSTIRIFPLEVAA